MWASKRVKYNENVHSLIGSFLQISLDSLKEVLAGFLRKYPLNSRFKEGNSNCYKKGTKLHPDRGRRKKNILFFLGQGQERMISSELQPGGKAEALRRPHLQDPRTQCLPKIYV